MGLLDRIGAFDRYKVSPTQGTSGMLTGAGRPMSPFAQQAARQIGGALGLDMRTPEEKSKAVQQEAYRNFDPNNPESMNRVIKALALTNPNQAVQLANAVKKRKDDEISALADKAEREFKNDAYLQILNEVRTAQANKNDIDLQKVFEISDSAGLDYKEVSNIIKQTDAASRTGTRSSTRVGIIKAKDKDGNVLGQYNVSSIYDPVTDTTQTRNNPIGRSPAFSSLPDDTTIDFISNTTGLSGFEQNALKQANEKLRATLANFEKEYAEASEAAQESIDKYVQASEGVTIGKRMLSALEIINTGGTLQTALKALGDTLGTTPPDMGQFVIDAGNLMIRKLEAYGSNPTDGERTAAEQLVPQIRNSKQLNRSIITVFLEEMQRRQKINKFRSTQIVDDDSPGGRRYPRPEEVIKYSEELYAGGGTTTGTYSFEVVE